MERWGSVVFPFSRVTFSEVLTDQSAPTAAGFLRRATAWFGSQGITIERVLSDNGGCYRSREFLKTCAELSIAPRRTRPYRPQTNGKEERMIQTLIREWAYPRLLPHFLRAHRRPCRLPTSIQFPSQTFSNRPYPHDASYPEQRLGKRHPSELAGLRARMQAVARVR